MYGAWSWQSSVSLWDRTACNFTTRRQFLSCRGSTERAICLEEHCVSNGKTTLWQNWNIFTLPVLYNMFWLVWVEFLIHDQKCAKQTSVTPCLSSKINDRHKFYIDEMLLCLWQLAMITKINFLWVMKNNRFWLDWAEFLIQDQRAPDRLLWHPI